MKIQIENLGKLKKIEYEVGNLTIICGHNNTGKTYAMYALYGFLSYLQGNEDQLFGREDVRLSRDRTLTKKYFKIYEDIDFAKFLVSDDKSIDDHYRIPIKDFCSFDKIVEVWKIIVQHFNETCLKDAVGLRNIASFKPLLNMELNAEMLHNIEDTFLKFFYTNHLDEIHALLNDAGKYGIVRVIPDQEVVNILYQGKKSQENLIYLFVIIRAALLVNFMRSSIICQKVHISTVERSGISMFSDELTIGKNKFVAELINNKKVTADDIRKITINMKYATPVNDNISFMGYEYRKHTDQESFIVKKHPEIIHLFQQIANGKYVVDNYGVIRHFPKKSKKSLTLNESSSAVRALADISFYLHHLAQKNDMLMIDEPELNLHPENQRLMAQLIAMLVNIGIKVMMTTHSDYLVREFNTLIMMKKKKEKNPTKTNKLMKKYGYDNLSLLNANQCCATFVKNNIHGNAEFSKIEIDEFYGIITENFDKTIQQMQDIQDDICFVE